MKDFLFSIIIPNYNGERYIFGCLESILSQSYENYEIIIVDGKSTDRSHEIIGNFHNGRKDKIKWIKENDTGISQAFNLGISYAQGDFVLLLGNDDYLYGEILQKLNSFLQRISFFPSVELDNISIFCDSINYWVDSGSFKLRKPQSSLMNAKNLIHFGNISGFQNIYINRKWFKQYQINEENRYSMDYETYFSMIEAGQQFFYFPEINSINSLGENTTIKYWYQSQKEANGIALKYAKTFADYFSIFKRAIMREILRFFKKVTY